MHDELALDVHAFALDEDEEVIPGVDDGDDEEDDDDLGDDGEDEEF